MTRTPTVAGVRGPLATGRSTVMAPRGMVATGHPLASAAGLNILQRGGNAMDAALAAASVLGVVQPMMSGVGGETFLLWFDARARAVTALNGSGAAPRGLAPEALRSGSARGLPVRGMASVSVPGAVDAMATALARWGSGRFSLATLLEPAIRYADDGVPVAPVVALWIEEARPLFDTFPSTRKVFAPAGHPLRAGELLVQKDLAQTLSQIAEGGSDDFYRGPLAQAIAQYATSHEGLLAAEDLRNHRSEIVEPLKTAYRDLTVYTTPPPSQGIVLLMMLNILEGVPRGLLRWGHLDGIHHMVEAKNRAFAARLAYLGDPRFISNPIDLLLNKQWAAEHLAQITAGVPSRPSGSAAAGDTTYLCVGDGAGNLVSFISSLSAKFGCGEIIEGTGILLNNRAGRGFSLDARHPNSLAPGKRTMHTLMPFMAFRGGAPRYVFGTPGGDGQPQWNLQVFLNLVESAMDVQSAIEAPRWFSFPGTDPATIGWAPQLELEEGFPDGVVEALRARGHTVVPMSTEEGKGLQLIAVEPGFYLAGSDPRIDGLAIGC